LKKNWHLSSKKKNKAPTKKSLPTTAAASMIPYISSTALTNITLLATVKGGKTVNEEKKKPSKVKTEN
jgi:hypothetical protein